MAKRRPNNTTEEHVEFAYDHAALTADTTVKLWKCPAGRKFRVDSVEYINPTGLAAHAADFFALKLNKGATLVADWSTETGQEGTIAADTFVSFTNAALAARSFTAGDVMSIQFDESGTATLPAGRLVVRGKYVE